MKPNRFYFLLVFLWLIFSPFPGIASTIQEARVWSGIDLSGPLVPESNFIYDFAPQARSNITTSQYNQTNVDAAIGYTINPNFTIWLGSTTVIPGSANGRNDAWQQSIWNLLHKDKVILALRTRLQERHNVNYSQWAIVFRQRFTLQFPKLTLHGCTPILYDEIFINLNHPVWINTKTIDQNRLFSGLRFTVKKAVSLDLGYLNQYLFLSNGHHINNIIYINLNFVT